MAELTSDPKSRAVEKSDSTATAVDTDAPYQLKKLDRADRDLLRAALAIGSLAGQRATRGLLDSLLTHLGVPEAKVNESNPNYIDMPEERQQWYEALAGLSPRNPS